MSASPKQEKNIDSEIEAVQTICGALDRFDPPARQRIMLAAQALLAPESRHGPGPQIPPPSMPQGAPQKRD